MKRKFRYRRTSEVKVTSEARLLRKLREESGLSIREVSRRIGKSESYLRHIEKGRLDVPSRANLEEILNIYDVSWRMFTSKNRFDLQISDREYLNDLISSLSDSEVSVVLKIVKNITS